MNRRSKSQPNDRKTKKGKDSKKSKKKTSQIKKISSQNSQQITSQVQKAFICKSTRGRIEQKEWSLQDETKLYNLHDQIGNKWTIIAKQFTSRTDNDVKNHLFSRYRLSIRRLNRIISAYPNFKFKQLKMSIISKIITTCESRFNSSLKISQDLLNFCLNLKKEIIWFLYEHHTDILSENVIKLIKNLHTFNNFHNKDKKINNVSTSQVEDEINNDQLVNTDSYIKEQEIEVQRYQPVRNNTQIFSQYDEVVYFKKFFNDEIHQIPNIPFKIYLPDHNNYQQDMNQNQNQKYQIILGNDHYNYQPQVQTILPPFLSLDQAYNYDKQESNDCQFGHYLGNQ